LQRTSSLLEAELKRILTAKNAKSAKKNGDPFALFAFFAVKSLLFANLTTQFLKEELS